MFTRRKSNTNAGIGLNVGSSGSSDLRKFIAVFEPLGADTSAGEDLRGEAWFLADPNGNGLCSLAELESFILKMLLAAYPKRGHKEEGRELFSSFRPCYLRAFTDAKDYKADTGRVIKGTRNSTDDDFVSMEEFRLFNAYACIYAAMFDAFAKLDGGGAGRDAGDDLRLESREWLKGYKGVQSHGFVALANVRSKEQARAAFAQMDDNGGGIVLLDEFSYWIKEEEIKAGTAMGEILSLDEAGGVGQRADKLKATKKPLPGRVSMADVQAKAAKREARLAERRASGGIEEIIRQEEAARGPARPNMTMAELKKYEENERKKMAARERASDMKERRAVKEAEQAAARERQAAEMKHREEQMKLKEAKRQAKLAADKQARKDRNRENLETRKTFKQLQEQAEADGQKAAIDEYKRKSMTLRANASEKKSREKNAKSFQNRLEADARREARQKALDDEAEANREMMQQNSRASENLNATNAEKRAAERRARLDRRKEEQETRRSYMNAQAAEQQSSRRHSRESAIGLMGSAPV